MVLKPGMTAYDLWKGLEDLFRDNKDSHAMQLDQDLRSIEIRNMSIHDYCHKIKVLSDLLANIDQPVPEKNLVIYMINGLGDKFDNVSSIIRHQRPIPSFQQARSMLMVEETRLLHPRSSTATHRDHSSSPASLFTGIDAQNPSHQPRLGDQDRRQNDGGDRRQHFDRRQQNNRRRGSDKRQQDRRSNSGGNSAWGSWNTYYPPPWAALNW
ncbi:uncharacterized protein LOC111902290 [Lactuca sativa]|uniref:uncharacterized protein LOC111902290 n=1 Tax=Lactuca sativa TaxID=4236 RepID=UPI000CD7E547|nr:uncharacterized protein LOC111902290 [Lactuca sativa]